MKTYFWVNKKGQFEKVFVNVIGVTPKGLFFKCTFVEDTLLPGERGNELYKAGSSINVPKNALHTEGE